MAHISLRFLRIESRDPENVNYTKKPNIIQRAFSHLLDSRAPSRPHGKACVGGSTKSEVLNNNI